MKKWLYPDTGKFYKCNLHCHTNISDGQQSPEEVKAFYKENGYSAVCYTDHEVLIDHRDLCDNEFIALHGYEVAIKQDLTKHTANFMPVYHFNLIAEKQDNLLMPRCFKDNPSYPGKSKEWFDKYAKYDENDLITTTKYDKEWISNYLCAVRDAGFLVTYNHPQWSLQNCNDYIGLRGLHAIEALNGSCYALGDASTSIHLEQMIRSGMNVASVGGDDNHHVSKSGKAWTMIKAQDLSYDSLIDGYKNGYCYASCGPEINELYIEDGKIFIKTSHAALIFLRGEGRHCQIAQNCSEAVFEYMPQLFGKYFRIEVKDESGKCAFTGAFYCDSL